MENERGSGYGSIPGEEFPAAVYGSVIIAFAWMVAASWLAFGGIAETELDLTIVTVLCLVFLALPILIYRTTRNRLQRPHPIYDDFLSSRVAVATGELSGREAWLQVILIPFALALGATIIGGVYLLTQ